MVRFIDDLLIGMLSFIPEKKRFFCQKRMQDWNDFFYGLRDKYPILKAIPFRDKGDAGVDSRALEQARTNISGYYFETKDPVTGLCEINKGNCITNFSGNRIIFSEDEVRQLQEIAKLYEERFCLPAEEVRS